MSQITVHQLNSSVTKLRNAAQILLEMGGDACIAEEIVTQVADFLDSRTTGFIPSELDTLESEFGKLKEEHQETEWLVGQLKETMGEIELDCAIAKSVIEQAETRRNGDAGLETLLDLAKQKVFAASRKSRKTELEVPF